MSITRYEAGKFKEGALKLSSNESNYGIAPEVQKAISKGIPHINKYPDSAQTALKETLSDYLGVDTTQIVLGNGSDEVITFICTALLEKNDSVISAKETFSVYRIATEIAGGYYHTVPLKDGYFDMTEIQNTQSRLTSKLVFICNPNNPTGTCLPIADLKAQIQALSYSCYVILDEAYLDFSDDEYSCSIAEKLSWHPNLIILRTFSKVFALGGIRIGFGIANTTLSSRIASVRMPFHINSIAQIAARSSIEHLSYYLNVVAKIKSERARLSDAIAKMNLSCYPSQTNFICIPSILPKTSMQKNEINTNFEKRPLSDLAFDFFSSHNVMIRSLNSFSIPDGVRITVGTPSENDRVIDILQQWCNNH